MHIVPGFSVEKIKITYWQITMKERYLNALPQRAALMLTALNKEGCSVQPSLPLYYITTINNH
jgi:hypothetical protein